MWPGFVHLRHLVWVHRSVFPIIIQFLREFLELERLNFIVSFYSKRCVHCLFMTRIVQSYRCYGKIICPNDKLWVILAALGLSRQPLQIPTASITYGNFCFVPPACINKCRLVNEPQLAPVPKFPLTHCWGSGNLGRCQRTVIDPPRVRFPDNASCLFLHKAWLCIFLGNVLFFHWFDVALAF